MTNDHEIVCFSSSNSWHLPLAFIVCVCWLVWSCHDFHTHFLGLHVHRRISCELQISFIVLIGNQNLNTRRSIFSSIQTTVFPLRESSITPTAIMACLFSLFKLVYVILSVLILMDHFEYIYKYLEMFKPDTFFSNNQFGNYCCVWAHVFHLLIFDLIRQQLTRWECSSVCSFASQAYWVPSKRRSPSPPPMVSFCWWFCCWWLEWIISSICTWAPQYTPSSLWLCSSTDVRRRERLVPEVIVLWLLSRIEPLRLPLALVRWPSILRMEAMRRSRPRPPRHLRRHMNLRPVITTTTTSLAPIPTTQVSFTSILSTTLPLRPIRSCTNRSSPTRIRITGTLVEYQLPFSKGFSIFDTQFRIYTSPALCTDI